MIRKNLKRKWNRTNTHTQITEHACSLTKIFHFEDAGFNERIIIKIILKTGISVSD
jgi:hypothetical protein